MSDSTTSNNTGSFPAAYQRLELLEADRDTSSRLPEWATQFRTPALARFLETGLPNRRNEEWKYTSLKTIGSERYALPLEDESQGQLHDELVKLHVPDVSAHELSLV